MLSVDDVLHDLVERGGRALRVAARPASVDRVREHRDGHLAHNRRHAWDVACMHTPMLP